APDAQPPIAPRLGLQPAAGIDDVEDVGMAPLVRVGLAERPAITGRATEVDVEHGEAFEDEELLERLPRSIGLRGRPAVRIDHRRALGAPTPAGRGRRPPERALDPQAVACGDRDTFPAREPRDGG